MTVEEEELCYDIFFETCQPIKRLNDSTIFNNIWASVAEELSVALGKGSANGESLRQNSEASYTVKSILHLADKIRVTPHNLTTLREECDIHRHWRVHGFLRYCQCRFIFMVKDAAPIDFGDDPTLELPGGRVNDPMVVDESESDKDPSWNEAIEEMDSCNWDPFAREWDVGLHQGTSTPSSASMEGPSSGENESDIPD